MGGAAPVTSVPDHQADRVLALPSLTVRGQTRIPAGRLSPELHDWGVVVNRSSPSHWNGYWGSTDMHHTHEAGLLFFPGTGLRFGFPVGDFLHRERKTASCLGIDMVHGRDAGEVDESPVGRPTTKRARGLSRS